tara:strand:+ start:397 stop:639 length:243 start_codon:yes stop_codon:yes gene_type:complete
MSAKIVVEVANDNEYDERNPTYLDAKQVGEAALAMADRITYVNGRTLLEMIQVTGDSDALMKAKLEAENKTSELKSEKEK